MADNPIRGNPSEFESLEKLFCTIKVRTENLESDLRSIANGTSSNFRGEAADTFRENLDKLAPLIREVPDIACDVERIFGDHKTRLIQLQRAADSAVARAETNWNEQRRADAAYDDADRDVWTKRGQLLITPLWETDERTQLRCELDALEDHRAIARDRLDRANDSANASEAELRDLADDEEQLNERTANELKRVDVGVLADPSLLEKLVNGFLEAVKYAAAFSVGGVVGLLFILPTEVLQGLYEALDWILVALAVVVVIVLIVGTGGTFALVLAGVIVSALRLATGLVLYSRGENTLGNVLWDALGLVLSVAGGVATFRPSLSRGMQTLRDLGDAGTGITIGKKAGEELLEALIGDDDDGIPDDWRVCTAPVTSDGSESFGTYAIDLPDVDVVPAMDGMMGSADIRTTPDSLNSIVVSVADIGTLDGMVMDFDFGFGDGSFENLVDFVYEVDLDFEFGDFEIIIESHFDFSPPEVVFADFHRAYEQNLRPLLVPCELGTTL